MTTSPVPYISISTRIGTVYPLKLLCEKRRGRVKLCWKSAEVRNGIEPCPFNWWLNRTYMCNLHDPSRFSRSLQFAAVTLSHNHYGSYLQVQLHTGRENLFKVIFFWFSRWEMECRGRGVEQASGWQAWKRPGQTMMTIDVGNEQRVTSLAGRMRLVFKGRESGVGWVAMVGCKDNGSRDINSNEAHLSPKTLRIGHPGIKFYYMLQKEL